jgi:hypothetical protein
MKRRRQNVVLTNYAKQRNDPELAGYSSFRSLTIASSGMSPSTNGRSGFHSRTDG